MIVVGTDCLTLSVSVNHKSPNLSGLQFLGKTPKIFHRSLSRTVTVIRAISLKTRGGGGDLTIFQPHPHPCDIFQLVLPPPPTTFSILLVMHCAAPLPPRGIIVLLITPPTTYFHIFSGHPTPILFNGIALKANLMLENFRQIRPGIRFVQDCYLAEGKFLHH